MGLDRDMDGESKSGTDRSESAGRRCPECGAENALDAVICSECHTALVASPKKTRQSRRRSKARSAARLDDAVEGSRRRHPSVRARRLWRSDSSRLVPSDLETTRRGSATESEGLSEPESFSHVMIETGERGEEVRSDSRIGDDKREPGLKKRGRIKGRRAAEEPRSKRRLRATKRSQSREAILWEGKLSTTQRLNQWIPDTALGVARRVARKVDAKVIVAVGIAVAIATAVFVVVSSRPKPRHDTAEGLGLGFELSDRWQDVRNGAEWPGYFVVTSKILSSGAQPSMVFVKGNTGLALLSREVSTDTTPPEAALQDAEEIGLVYGLSSDTRLQGRGAVEYFGSSGTAFIAERWVSGEYYNEEVIVLPLGDRVVYVVFTAPKSVWDSERVEIEKILRSARPTA
jgi:hypothetical protein